MLGYSALSVYLGVAALITAVLVLMAGKLSPSSPSEAKPRPYECGVSRRDTSTAGRFALVAMLFLVFDVEALFFYPWAVLSASSAGTGFWPSPLFAVLGVGYIYARARGALMALT